MATTIIAVTQADIDKANTFRKEHHNFISSRRCPVAQALLRQSPGAALAYASPDQLEVTDDEGSPAWKANSTESIRRFMRRWDRTWQAVPTRFRVTLR